ncbi:rhodanese-like domain-containing protein, partial [Francisella tularensis subsp. holarctica]|nr:rhodanese-like domain-containing protein [Francisella tularensis subsp. holarctica]
NLLFCLSFILRLAIYIVFELTQTKKAQYTLSVSDAVITVNKGKGVYLDIRDYENFSKEHIIGAQNIQYDEKTTKHN